MGVERLEHHWRTTPLDCVALLGVGRTSGDPLATHPCEPSSTS